MDAKYKINFFLFFELCFYSLVRGEKIDLACDEYGTDLDEILYDGVYCTISQLHIGYGDEVNCDVYPYYRERIRVVNFTESQMPFIPHGIFRYLTGIRQFDISFTGIEVVHRDFEGAKNLMFLTMTNNNLTELSASLFADAPNISVVDFAHNQIERINPFTFVDATSLSSLQFSYNRLKKLDAQTFEKLYALDFIALDHNELEYIDVELFARNSLLQKVLLNNNRIVSLDCEAFAHIDYLSSLDLSHNRLLGFSTSCFRRQLPLSLAIRNNRITNLTVINIDSLDASNNNISMLEMEDDSSILETLIVANNSLVNITSWFRRLRSLKQLDISWNKIGRLNIGAFANLKKLNKLYLKRTQLSGIDYGTFANQMELKVLDISYNDLNHIDFDVFFPYLKGLEELYIDGNNLTEAGGLSLTVNSFPNLKSIGLSHNRFNCSYLTKLITCLNSDNVTLTVDSANEIGNTTHVHGVVCTNVKSINDHLTIHADDNHNDRSNRRHDRSQKQIDNLNEQVNMLREKNAILRYQESTLESHIRSIKYLIALICALSLTFVVAKLIHTFKKHKKSESFIYHSTATMNTQHTSAD